MSTALPELVLFKAVARVFGPGAFVTSVAVIFSRDWGEGRLAAASAFCPSPLCYTPGPDIGGRMRKKAGGPYLQAALFCERVLQEKDEVLSLIRVIDRVILRAVGSAPPDQMPAGIVACQAVIMLKTGSLAGKYKLGLLPTTPSGKVLPETSVGILLEGGEDRGINVILNVQFLAQEEGIYWFDLKLENQLLTRIPLRLVYQPLTQSSQPGTP